MIAGAAYLATVLQQRDLTPQDLEETFGPGWLYTGRERVNHRTLLHEALKYQRANTVPLFIRLGASRLTEVTGPDMWSYEHTIACFYGPDYVGLLPLPGPPNPVLPGHCPPVRLAILEKNIMGLRYLLEGDPRPEVTKWLEAAYQAVKCQRGRMLVYLLTLRPDLNLLGTTYAGRTLLQHACRRGALKSVHILLDLGANPLPARAMFRRLERSGAPARTVALIRRYITGACIACESATHETFLAKE